MDRLEAMVLLLDTVDAGSFSAAARKRGVPVATLTRKIGQLEQYLGTVLLLRSTRRLTLTDAGQRYVAASRGIVAQICEIERDAADEFIEPTGRLVVSAPRMFGRLHVLPIVADFLEQHPGISIDLQLVDNNVDLLAGAADVAIRIGVLPDSSLVATRVGSMRSVLVGSPALIERHPVPSSPNELASMPAIVIDMPLAVNAAASVTDITRHFGPPRLIVSTAEAAAEAVERGIGVARLLHYQVAAGIAAGRLRSLLEDFEPEPAPVHMVHAPLSQLPQKIRRFLDFAGERLRKPLAELQYGGDA